MTAAILQAAQLSFAENGFAGTTIQNLTLEIGVTRRSILQRFGTKDDLLIAVASRDTSAFVETLNQAPMREAHFEDDLREICTLLWFRGLDTRESALLRTYFGEMVRLPQLAVVVRQFYYGMADALSAKVRDAQTFGRFQDKDPAAVADCAISMYVSTPRLRTMLLDPQITDRVQGAAHRDMLWRFMRDLA